MLPGGSWGLPEMGGVPTILENQMEKKMENEMETGIICLKAAKLVALWPCNNWRATCRVHLSWRPKRSKAAHGSPPLLEARKLSPELPLPNRDAARKSGHKWEAAYYAY